MGDLIWRIFRPAYWLMQQKYSEAWDRFILQAIADGKITRTSTHTADVNGKCVWVSNFPYAFGHGYSKDENALRPHAKHLRLLADAAALAPHKGTPEAET